MLQGARMSDEKHKGVFGESPRRLSEWLELKDYFDYTRRRIKQVEEKALRLLAVKALRKSLGREPSEDEIAEEIKRQRLIVEEQRLQWRQGVTEPFDIDAEIEEAQKIFGDIDGKEEMKKILADIKAKKTEGDLPDE
jgi:DNA-directed RNA polymerase specialized sigma subunit